MTQMPQMVALFNGVGGGAAALVALLELHEIVDADRRRRRLVRPGRDRVHDRRRLGLLRRLDRHLRQAPGADDLAAGGLPRPAGRLRRRAASPRSCCRCCWSLEPDDVGSASCSALVGLARRRAAGAAGRRRRRPDRDLAAQRVHRPHRRRRRLRAGQHPAARRRHPRRRLRHVPDPADGQGDGPLGRQHPVRRPQGRLDARRRRGLRPAGAVGRARGRRDPARRTPTG